MVGIYFTEETVEVTFPTVALKHWSFGYFGKHRMDKSQGADLDTSVFMPC